MESKQQKGKMDMSSLKTVNKLQYQLPSNLNVVERRQNKVSFADQNTYSSTSGNEVVIRLTASTDYVYGKNSYLTFDILAADVDVVGTLGFFKNTAMSLFSRVLLEDRSGAELERNDKLNSYCAQVAPWHHPTGYKDTVCAMAGQFEGSTKLGDLTLGIPSVPAVFTKNGIVADYDAAASKLTVCIPMSMFLGTFNRETLIPSMLVSGALLRLQLETPAVALESLGTVATGAVSYTITNPRVVMDSMALAPVVQKNLMEQSQASGGLDFTYETVYYQSGNPGTSTNFNLQINKAVSRCQRLYWSSHSQTTPSSSNIDSLGTTQANCHQLDYRLGDLYFPQRVISVTGAVSKTGAELYQNSLQSVGKMRTSSDPCSITKSEFLTSGVTLAANSSNSGRCVHVQTFEQSSALEYSGLAINNSRTLEARISFGAAAIAEAQVIDAWISYVKLAKCNQLRVILKE